MLIREAARLASEGMTRDHDVLLRAMTIRERLASLRAPLRAVARKLNRGPVDWQRRFVEHSAWSRELIQLLTRLPPGFVTSYSMRPDSASWILARIEEQRSKLVVEAGCGISTVLLAFQAKRSAGALRAISLEPEEEWRTKTLTVLEQLDLAAFADVRHATLIDFEWDGAARKGFATGALRDLDEIDFLIVDSPPGTLGRIGVLPQLAPRLARRATVILDDASRLGERDAALAWDREGVAQLEGFVPVGRGLAALRSGE